MSVNLAEMLRTGIVWEANSPTDELILRCSGPRYLRIKPNGAYGSSARLNYDIVVEVADGVWAVPPDKE